MINQIDSFAEIKSYPENFNTSTVLSRVIDGVGFKYFWATEGLSESDLQFSPGNENRNLYQTLDHMYNMLDFVGYTLEGKVYPFPETNNGWSFPELRDQTLKRIAEVKSLFLSDASALGDKPIQITMGEQPMEFPIWHLFNGPLIDFMSHLGQVVAFRRVNGNPIDSGVQPFMGKRMEA